MRFKEFLEEEPGKVHLRKTDKPVAKGTAPKDKARAFDKKGINRSVLKKLNDKSGTFYVIEGDVEFHDWSDDKNDELMRSPNYLLVHVVGANSLEAFDKGDYSGITVYIPLKDDKFELDPAEEADFTAGGGGADKQVKNYELSIVKAVIDALKKDDIPGIYDGLDGMKSKVPKVGGIAEWEAKQLSKLKNKKQD